VLRPDFRSFGCQKLRLLLLIASFYSGSTGKPKVVPLRHDQILASCSGKSNHHRTSSESRFLNWIAFDHVASIIEIHIHALLIDAV
jgi:long-subunit acyl-CoA synthetase (AMP-forming)